MLELVKTFKQVNGVLIPCVVTKRRLGIIAACYADATNASEKLRWNAEKTLEDMCRDAWPVCDGCSRRVSGLHRSLFNNA